MKGKDRVARAAYVTATGNRVVVMHVFVKKARATPRREIETALRKAKRFDDAQIHPRGGGRPAMDETAGVRRRL